MAAESATVSRFGGDVLFFNLNWTIRTGETWAIVGPVGSGKTSLAETILGKHRVVEGSIHWPIVERLGATVPADVIRRVSFKEESRLFSYGRHYYQQRFNFIEPEDDISLDSFLRAGLNVPDEEIESVAARLGIESLRPLSLIKLSNGQMRRARLTRALLAKPAWLILDEPFMGLDVAGRSDLAAVLADVIASGTHVTLITRPEFLPDWVSDVLELKPRKETRSSLPSVPRPRESEPVPTAISDAVPIIELNDVTVRYSGKAVLEGVQWTVRPGERWALLGPNGSGKTTLLSLLAGDHPQAYANDVRLFGHRRGSGESIWEIKQRIGMVSPEFHLYFSEPLSAFDAAATGFHDALVYRPITSDQEHALMELFAGFGLSALADVPFRQLSTGQQRLVLFVRALAKSPPLLILDEPFQGLDAASIAMAREWLDTRLSAEQTLIFVSHYPEEIPTTVNRILRLESGRVVETT